MVITIPDSQIRNVKLTGDEIELIIEELERVPHNLYEFLNYEKLIKKLNDSLQKQIKCIMSKDGRCTSDYSPLKCNGIDIPKDCTYALQRNGERK